LGIILTCNFGAIFMARAKYATVTFFPESYHGIQQKHPPSCGRCLLAGRSTMRVADELHYAAFSSMAAVVWQTASRLVFQKRRKLRRMRSRLWYENGRHICSTRCTTRDDHVAVITGGTSRFGGAIARGLAETKKYGRIIIIGRDGRRGSTVIKELQDLSVQAEFMQADLSCLDEVWGVCRELQGVKLHCLVCAAGATALPHRRETCDGYEYHFGLNFLSRFLMVNTLLEELSATGTLADPARVLLVGSDRHWGAPLLGFSSLGRSLPLGLGQLEDLQFKEPGEYGAWEAFGQAALCNVMFAYALQKQLGLRDSATVAVSCVDPGPMETAWNLYSTEENRLLANGIPNWLKGPFSFFTRLVEKPEVAAQVTVLLASTPLGALPCASPWPFNAGCYFERGIPAPSKFPVPWSWGTSYDERLWAQLWRYAVELTKGHLTPKQARNWHENTNHGLLAPKAFLYPWLWFWWHAPRHLGLAFSGRSDAAKMHQ